MIPLIYKNIKKDLYFIEPDGRIFSKIKKDYITPRKDKNGYLQVFLQKNEGGRNNRCCYRVATLVIYSFIGPPPLEMKDPTVNHIDGNILNNSYLNLEWLERGINSKIRENKGQGIKNHEAKLTEQQVYEICILLQQTNLTLTEIGKKYHVEKSTISNILKKKNWQYITSQFDFSTRKIIRNSEGRYEIINLNNEQDGGK